MRAACGVTVPDGSWHVSEDARIFITLAGPAALLWFKGGASDEQIACTAAGQSGHAWPDIEAVAHIPAGATGASHGPTRSRSSVNHGRHGEATAGTARPTHELSAGCGWRAHSRPERHHHEWLAGNRP